MAELLSPRPRLRERPSCPGVIQMEAWESSGLIGMSQQTRFARAASIGPHKTFEPTTVAIFSPP